MREKGVGREWEREKEERKGEGWRGERGGKGRASYDSCRNRDE